jgi:hypothetical protein
MNALIALVLSMAFADVEKGVSSVLTSQKKPWFVVTNQTTVLDSGTSYQVTFTDANSKTLSVEKIQVDKQRTLQNYEWDQSQTHEQAKIELAHNQLTFRYTKNGKASAPKTQKLSNKEVAEIVVPPLLVPYIVAHWDDLVTKGRLDLLIAVPNMQDTFRFHVTRGDSSDPQQTVWTLRATSLFVQMAVSPVNFVFAANRQLVLAKNIAPPVQFEDSPGHLTERKSDIAFSREPK